MELVRYLIEWVHFILRHPRDVQLGQHVGRLLWPGPGRKVTQRKINFARKYMAMMGDHDHRQRHIEAFTRAGY